MEPLPLSGPWQFILNRSRWFFVTIVVLTLPLSFYAIHVQLDSRISSFVDEAAPEYKTYQKFIEAFGSDQIIFLLVQNQLPASDPRIHHAFAPVLETLAGMDDVASVDSFYGIAPFFSEIIPGLEGVWTTEGLRKLLRCIPSLQRFISADLKTLGLAVTLKNAHPDGPDLIRSVNQMCRVVTQGFYGKPECHAVGFSILQAAFENYNLQSAIQFGLVSFIVGTLIALYIFKSLRVSLVIMVSCIMAMVWTLGIMGAARIPLSLATGMCFGFIMVICTTTVMHIFTQYYEMNAISDDRYACLGCAYGMVGMPCLMCALTTSAGFLTLVLSPLEMVRHAGLVTAMGSMTGFLMASVSAFFFIQLFQAPGQKVRGRIRLDILSRLVRVLGKWGPERPLQVIVCSGLFLGLMVMGILYIKPGDLGLNTLSQRTEESRNLALMNARLLPIETVSLVFDPLSGSRPSTRLWQALDQLEQDLCAEGHVSRIESLSTLSRQISALLPSGAARPEDIRNHLLNGLGYEELTGHLYNADSGWIRLNLYLPEGHANERAESISRILSQARKAVSGVARVDIHGYQSLMQNQVQNLLSAQLKSLAAALLIITVLMSLQLRSLTLALISLIPNIFPITAIFGIMGLLHIPLDPLTIFAAVVSFGLSVDDSIHFLNQLKRELRQVQYSLRTCIERAYGVTARALISTTAVLSFSCVGLFFSPFTHVRSLGILISSASVVALMGDIVVMPAVILTCRPIARVLTKTQHV